MFDTQRSYFNDLREKPLLPGASVLEEGQVMVLLSDGAGGLGVQPSTGAGGAADGTFLGFAITDAKKVLTDVVVETFNIPAVAPYTVTLKNQNVLIAEARMYDNTAAAAMAITCPVPAATQYCATVAGLVTFNAAQAGDSVTFTYRYSLTVAQAMEKFHQRSINNTAQDFFGSVAVGCLDGEVFTSMYDASAAYVIGAAVYTGPGGKVTSAATSAVAVGIVSKMPSLSDPFLGVLYKSGV